MDLRARLVLMTRQTCLDLMTPGAGDRSLQMSTVEGRQLCAELGLQGLAWAL